MRNPELPVEVSQHTLQHNTPAQLFLQRDLRTRLSLLKSDPPSHVTNRQSKMKSYNDQHAKPREFCPGQTVLARDFRSAQKWQPATILERKAPYSYVVKLHDGRMWYRHADHLLQHNPNLDQVTISEDYQRDNTPLLPDYCDPKQTLTSPPHNTNASEGHTTTTTSITGDVSQGHVRSSVMSAALTADHRVIMKFSTYCSVILSLVSSTAPKHNKTQATVL